MSKVDRQKLLKKAADALTYEPELKDLGDRQKICKYIGYKLSEILEDLVASASRTTPEKSAALEEESDVYRRAVALSDKCAEAPSITEYSPVISQLKKMPSWPTVERRKTKLEAIFEEVDGREAESIDLGSGSSEDLLGLIPAVPLDSGGIGLILGEDPDLWDSDVEGTDTTEVLELSVSTDVVDAEEIEPVEVEEDVVVNPQKAEGQFLYEGTRIRLVNNTSSLVLGRNPDHRSEIRFKWYQWLVLRGTYATVLDYDKEEGYLLVDLELEPDLWPDVARPMGNQAWIPQGSRVEVIGR